MATPSQTEPLLAGREEWKPTQPALNRTVPEQDPGPRVGLLSAWTQEGSAPRRRSKPKNRRKRQGRTGSHGVTPRMPNAPAVKGSVGLCDLLGFHLSDVAPRCRGQLEPDLNRNRHSDNRKRGQKKGPPMPIPRRDITDAKGLDRAPEIGKSVDDSRAGCRGLSAPKIGGRCAGHEGRDSHGAHHDRHARSPHEHRGKAQRRRHEKGKHHHEPA